MLVCAFRVNYGNCDGREAVYLGFCGFAYFGCFFLVLLLVDACYGYDVTSLFDMMVSDFRW